MKKSNSVANVTIPSTTLNCLKQMLFSADKGVDLSSIIEDLAVDSNNADLTAINVALTFKGVKPEIDRSPRYGDLWESQGTFQRYEILDYSLIRNVVRYKITYLKVDAEGNVVEDTTNNESEATKDYQSFLSLDSTPDRCVSHILEYRERHK